MLILNGEFIPYHPEDCSFLKWRGLLRKELHEKKWEDPAYHLRLAITDRLGMCFCDEVGPPPQKEIEKIWELSNEMIDQHLQMRKWRWKMRFIGECCPRRLSALAEALVTKGFVRSRLGDEDYLVDPKLRSLAFQKLYGESRQKARKVMFNEWRERA